MATSNPPPTAMNPIADQAANSNWLRPRFHLTPLWGWMNDPCADPKSGTYHFWFQWVPSDTEWRNVIGWGHARSDDLVTWSRNETPSLMPKRPYDARGVFTGSKVPSAFSEPGKLLFVYTCVNDLADTQGYVAGQEGVASAMSMDGGTTLRRSVGNPLDLQCPAKNATGWRDPYVSTWPEMAAALSVPAETGFAALSGGFRDQGPTVFLYSLDQSDWTKWSPVGAIVAPVPCSPDYNTWRGDNGWNWECVSYFNLPDFTKSFLLVSSEGAKRDPAAAAPEVAELSRHQLWRAGKIVRPRHEEEEPTIDVSLGGVVDWGCLYAAQTLLDTQGRRLMWGWMRDDLEPRHRSEQGWAGAQSLPRQLFVQEVNHVLGTIKTDLKDLPNLDVSPAQDGQSSVVRTLGQRFATEASVPFTNAATLPMKQAPAWEAKLRVAVDGVSAVGLRLQGENGESVIEFTPHSEQVTVSRVTPLLDPIHSPTAEKGNHTLFKTADGLEELVVHVIWDAPALEIIANDRFALATFLYGGPTAAVPFAKDLDGSNIDFPGQVDIRTP